MNITLVYNFLVQLSLFTYLKTKLFLTSCPPTKWSTLCLLTRSWQAVTICKLLYSLERCYCEVVHTAKESNKSFQM